jgi:hypothetical protein
MPHETDELTIGDYVLATKYSDGDPLDPWCVGYFRGKCGDRSLVADAAGVLFRAGGFRRAEKIDPVEGAYILGMDPRLRESIGSLWLLVRGNAWPHTTDGIPNGALPMWGEVYITPSRGMQVYPAGTLFAETICGCRVIANYVVKSACAIAAQSARGEK